MVHSIHGYLVQDISYALLRWANNESISVLIAPLFPVPGFLPLFPPLLLLRLKWCRSFISPETNQSHIPKSWEGLCNILSQLIVPVLFMELKCFECLPLSDKHSQVGSERTQVSGCNQSSNFSSTCYQIQSGKSLYFTCKVEIVIPTSLNLHKDPMKGFNIHWPRHYLMWSFRKVNSPSLPLYLSVKRHREGQRSLRSLLPQ